MRVGTANRARNSLPPADNEMNRQAESASGIPRKLICVNSRTGDCCCAICVLSHFRRFRREHEQESPLPPGAVHTGPVPVKLLYYGRPLGSDRSAVSTRCSRCAHPLLCNRDDLFLPRTGTGISIRCGEVSKTTSSRCVSRHNPQARGRATLDIQNFAHVPIIAAGMVTRPRAHVRE